MCVCVCAYERHRQREREGEKEGEREMVLNYCPDLRSLINIDIEHILLCLLAICVSSFMKYLIKYFTHFYF